MKSRFGSKLALFQQSNNKRTQMHSWKGEASSDGAIWEDYLNTQFQAVNYGIYAKCSIMKVEKLNLKRATRNQRDGWICITEAETDVLEEMVQQGIVFKDPSSVYHHNAISFIVLVDAFLKSKYNPQMGRVYASPFLWTTRESQLSLLCAIKTATWKYEHMVIMW